MAIPLAATFSLLLATFFRENDKAILDAINAALPYQSLKLTANLRDFIESARTISGIGLVALVATALRLIFVVESCINHVWGAPKRKRPVARVAIYTLCLFIGSLLLGVFIDGTEHLQKHAFFKDVLASALFGRLAATLVVAVALTLLYRFVPNAAVSWTSAAVAGIIVALLLRVIKIGFQLYFSIIDTINIIYGSLSLVLLVLIALFLFWELVLWGVELTSVLDARIASSAPQPAHGKAEGAVRLLVALAAAAGPLRLEELQQAASRDTSETESILANLAAASLVAGDRLRGFALGDDPRKITLERILSALWPGLLTVDPAGNDRVARILRRLFRKFSAEQQSVFSINLDQLGGRK